MSSSKVGKEQDGREKHQHIYEGARSFEREDDDDFCPVESKSEDQPLRLEPNRVIVDRTMFSSNVGQEQVRHEQYQDNLGHAKSFEDDDLFFPLETKHESSSGAKSMPKSPSPVSRVAAQSQLSPTVTPFTPTMTHGGTPDENAASTGAGSFSLPAPDPFPIRSFTMPAALGTVLSDGDLEATDPRPPSPTSMGSPPTTATQAQSRVTGVSKLRRQTTPQPATTELRKLRFVNRPAHLQGGSPRAPWAGFSPDLTGVIESSPQSINPGETHGRPVSPLSLSYPASLSLGSEDFPPLASPTDEAQHFTSTES